MQFQRATTVTSCTMKAKHGKKQLNHCRGEEAELAEIKSVKENWPLVDYIQIKGRKDLTWLGAKRTSEGSNFAWQSSGSPLSYTKLARSEST